VAQQVALSVSTLFDERWRLYYADRTGVRHGLLDTYEEAELVGRANDVSTWRVVLPSDTDAARFFMADSFARLEIDHDGLAWRSGPLAHLERTVDVDGDMLEIAGVDDTAWIYRRLAWPTPTLGYFTQTGPLSQVLAALVDHNLGPASPWAWRKVPGLTVPVPAPVGGTITVNARYQNLLAFMQDTSRPAGVIFDIVGLQFRAFLPRDLGAVFSAGLETLGGWKARAQAPNLNYALVAASGQLQSRLTRTVSDQASVDTWGLFEGFVDQRQTSDTAEMDKAGAEAVAAGVIPTTVVFTPLDTEGQKFGEDWQLGDLVTVKAGDLTVYDQIREVHVLLDDAGATVTPSVGAPAGDLQLFRSIAGLDRRVRQLERI
jgi:hypothetical protein